MENLTDIAVYIASLLFVLGLIGFCAWILRRFVLGDVAGPGKLLAGRARRIGVVEGVSVDARRRLVLVRRDGVEHLILIGGPTDLVVETGIEAQKNASVTDAPPKSASLLNQMWARRDGRAREQENM